jgi:hypothetical protein
MQQLSDLFQRFRDEVALQDLDLLPTLLNLVLALLLGQLLAWHYLRYSRVLSNKRKFARMFVFIAATTMLVISVVKTSLALSLGLVGALSIIRFRTPIKEPEELAYLFLAVAIGIGLGADQRVATCVMFLGILAYIALSDSRSGSSAPQRLLLHVVSELPADEEEAAAAENALTTLRRAAGEGVDQVDLRRVDVQDRTFNANLVLDLRTADEVGALLRRIRGSMPGATVSIVEGASLS